jgi:ABC-type bacteriocin/lantibiotic exporter with double-glycine peptidase domain
MGPSGEGKTTLLRILLGLVEPCGGKAELIGNSGKHYTINPGTRSVFAYVPQENSIFTGTIAHNLKIVAPEATESEMEQALKVACAWEFVEQFPDGLNHPLSTGGRGISEGQAQRLAIARALLCKAPVLLLDEATSGLDMDTERRLMENLRRSGLVRTCILVTHRPGSAQFCNRAYEISDRQIREVSHGA